MKKLSMTLLMTILFAEAAFASATGMPWEGPLQGILNSLTGPVAQIAGVGAVTIFGLGIAIAPGGGLLAKALPILTGLSVAFSAASWGLGFFGFGGGAIV